ncbi:Na+/H+ antiporter subunit E [Crassaminicella thermophila]|nr:Na+/H+ antiporter subunit E [Crassaminicella thermophila]
MGKIIKYMIFFMLFWVILAEKINFERLVIGTGICIGAYFFSNNIRISKKREYLLTPKKIYYLITYFFILIKEIVIANFQVARIVLSPNMEISPQIINFDTKLQSDFYRTILANSITLTPGTLTVLMEENRLVVHCLKKDYIEDVLNSKFEKILLKVEE